MEWAKQRMNEGVNITYSREGAIHESLDAIVSLHVMAKPDLNNLVLRDRRSDDIQYVIKGG
jgi:hypothetical protein